MPTYNFNKDRKLVNVESTSNTLPHSNLYIPNAVKLVYKDYCETRKTLGKELGEVSIVYNVNAKEGEKAFISTLCDCTSEETTGWIEIENHRLCNICGSLVIE